MRFHLIKPAKFLEQAVILTWVVLIGCSSPPRHLQTSKSDASDLLQKVIASYQAKRANGRIGIRPNWETANVKQAIRRARQLNSVSGWERAAAAAEKQSGWQFAADCWYKVSRLYQERNDLNMAYWAIREAQARETKVQIFIDHPSDRSKLVAKNYTGAKFEPIYGCFNGAFIDDETTLSPVLQEGHNTRRSVSEFNDRTGAHHAFFFIYMGYGQPFPKKWAEYLKSQGAGLQIAFEPSSYNQVQDDHYLQTFAADAKASGIPIFLRFASEMNGEWVPYHNSPEKYIAMFRLLASVMHKNAPCVAMVFCPFEIPERKIMRYYPGDKAVDWVGVNIYSVLFNDNDPDRIAEWRNPADQLKFIYSHFAATKPIYIGEFGAANRSSLDNAPRPDYAIVKATQMLTALRLIYPRVKAFHWLSMNAIKHAIPGRQLNDYSLLDDPEVALAYKGLIGNPYFLKQYEPKAMAPIEAEKLHSETLVSGVASFEAWVKTYNNLPTVVWLLDGKELSRDNLPGSYPLILDTTKVKNGRHILTLVVLDEHGFQVVQNDRAIIVRNP